MEQLKKDLQHEKDANTKLKATNDRLKQDLEASKGKRAFKTGGKCVRKCIQ